jgi:hypothetical protein
MSANVVAFPMPPVRELAEEELDLIDRIPLGYAYNFATPGAYFGKQENGLFWGASVLEPDRLPG